MQKKQLFNVAVVGATGAVGQEFLKILDERRFPVEKLCPLASEDSLGKTVLWRGKDLPVEILDEKSFADIDIAFFSAGGEVSLQYVPLAVQAGAVAVDNTAAFRMEPDVPLVVPEVNPQDITLCAKRSIIANPNCSTIQMVVVLHALAQKTPLKRVVVSTYQSVSGAGLSAMEELSRQTVALFSSQEMKIHQFPHRIAFNCLPQIDRFLEDGSTREEQKMARETQKILHTPLPVSATCVRVPVFYGHSEAVNVEFHSEFPPEEARRLLSQTPGVEVWDEPERSHYPMPMEAQGKDAIFVGRIRRDASVPHGLNLWIVADNVRKGAALNAIQIAELWVRLKQ